MSSPFYAFSRGVVTLCFRSLLRIEVTGAERVPPNGPLIVAANHVSYFDPPLVGWAMPRELHFMAKKELFAVPLLGPLIRCYNAFPVDRGRGDVGAVKCAVKVLRGGNALLIFPEGRRNRGTHSRAESGAALLASLSGAPVLPVYVGGTERVRPFSAIKVAFGAPFQPGDGKKASREDLAKRTDEIMERIFALREQGGT